MKRGYPLFAMISAVGLVGFVCGSAWSDDQVLETHSDEANSTGTISGVSTGGLSMGVQPTIGPTNGFVSGAFTLAHADWSGEVGQFLKAEGKPLGTIRLPDGTTFVGE